MKSGEKWTEYKGPPVGHFRKIRRVYQGVHCRNNYKTRKKSAKEEGQ